MAFRELDIRLPQNKQDRGRVKYINPRGVGTNTVN